MAEEMPRTITVSGSGTAEVQPDRATVQMSIVSRAVELKDAQAGAAKVTQKVLTLTDALDIDDSRVDTTGATVRPDYHWDRQREEQVLRGYVAERQMRVELRDLDKLGELIEGAVDAGVNQVSPPQLDSSKRRQTYRKALDNAARDARANAEQLAKSLGTELGDVMQVNAGGHSPRPPMPYQARAASMAMDAEAVETYNAADLSFSANVTVVFELP